MGEEREVDDAMFAMSFDSMSGGGCFVQCSDLCSEKPKVKEEERKKREKRKRGGILWAAESLPASPDQLERD